MAFCGKWRAITWQVFKIQSSSLPSKHTKLILGSSTNIHIASIHCLDGQKVRTSNSLISGTPLRQQVLQSQGLAANTPITINSMVPSNDDSFTFKTMLRMQKVSTSKKTGEIKILNDTIMKGYTPMNTDNADDTGL